MTRLGTFLEASSFCNLALRPSMALILKFCFGQEDGFLYLDFLRDLLSRSHKLEIGCCVNILIALDITVVMSRLELQGFSWGIFL